MALLAAILALPLPLPAGTPSHGVHPLSLRESIAAALDHTLTIRLVEREVQTAESARDRAFAEFLPTLSTFLDYTRKSEAPDVELPPALFTALGLPPPNSPLRATLGGQDVSSLKLTLQQPLFAGLSITNTYRRAGATLDIARSRLRTAQHTLAFDVVRAYLAVLRAQKGEDLSVQQVKALETQAAQAQAFFEGGALPKNDALKAEVELANARQNLIHAQNQVELAKATFNYTLGRDLDDPVLLEELLEIQPLGPIERRGAVQTAWERRPELQEGVQAVEAARLGVEVAKGQRLPQLSAIGAYTVDLVGGNPSASADRWEVGGVLQWKPFQGGRVRAQVLEARIGRERAADALEQQRERVALEVKEAILTLMEAQLKIRVAEKAIQQAEENFRISLERYGAKITTSTEVVDAEALLTQARTNYFNAIYDHQLASFALRKATGVILD
jgi:outer membrane protein TolC